MARNRRTTRWTRRESSALSSIARARRVSEGSLAHASSLCSDRAGDFSVPRGPSGEARRWSNPFWSPAAAASSAATSFATSSKPSRNRRSSISSPHLRRQSGQPGRSGRPSALSLRSRRHHRPRGGPHGRRRAACDGIVNFAAESHVDRSILDSGPFVQHQRRLARRSCWTRPASSRCRAICRSPPMRSTAASAQTGFFTEETPLAPNSPYAASKAAADLLVRSLRPHLRLRRRSSRAAPTITVRTSFPEKVIPLFITNLLRNEPVPVYGDGHADPRLDSRPRSCGRHRPGLAARARPARSTTSAAAAS